MISSNYWIEVYDKSSSIDEFLEQLLLSIDSPPIFTIVGKQDGENLKGWRVKLELTTARDKFWETVQLLSAFMDIGVFQDVTTERVLLDGGMTGQLTGFIKAETLSAYWIAEKFEQEIV